MQKATNGVNPPNSRIMVLVIVAVLLYSALQKY